MTTFRAETEAEMDNTNSLTHLFDHVYAFEDTSGNPLVISDLVSNQNLDMTYGAVGGATPQGMLLADNGNGQLNTYGILDTTVNSISMIMMVQGTWCVNSNDSFLTDSSSSGVLFMVNSSGVLKCYVRTGSSHDVRWTNIATGLNDGDSFTAVIYFDNINDNAFLCINGQTFGAVVSGVPDNNTVLNGTPLSRAVNVTRHYIGRSTQYDNYYGWDGVVGLFGTGFDCEGVTQEQCESLSADPYQIFRTAEDAVNDYGLKWSTVTQGLEVNNIVGDVDVEFQLTRDFATETTTMYLFDGRRFEGSTASGGGATRLYSSYGGAFTLVNITNLKIDGVAATGGELNTALAGQVISFTATGLTTGSVIIGCRYTGSAGSQILGLAYVKITDDNGLHYIDLNRTQGNPVDLTGNLTCTLVGFPTESGYVYENGEIVGYKFNGVDTSALATSTVFNMGDATWEVEADITLDSAGTASLVTFSYQGITVDSGAYISVWYGVSSGQYFRVAVSLTPNSRITVRVVKRSQTEHEVYLNGSSVLKLTTFDATPYPNKPVQYIGGGFASSKYAQINHSLSIKNAENGIFTNSYDFTTGDVDSIPDTVNGNNADIINAKTSGWMPIIEKQVFTVRADNLGDFPNIQSAVNTVRTNIGHQKVIAYDDENYGTGGQSFTPNGCDVLEICAETSRHFSNDLLNPIKLSSSSTAYTVRLDGKDNSGAKVFFHGFFVENTSSGNALEKYWATDPSGLVSVRDCKVTSVGGVGFSTAYNAGTNLPVEIKRVLAADCKNSGFHGKNNPNVTFIDCMAVNNAKVETADVQYSAGFADVKYAINCIASGSTQTGDFSGSSRVLTNCVSSDATATGDGCLADIDFTGAFVNG